MSFSQNEYSIAENYYRQAEYKKAIQYYQKLVNRNPFNSFYLKRLITCYQESNEFEIAKTYIEDALAINPNQTYWFVELGYNYQRQQKDSLAQTQYKKAIESIKSNPSIGGMTGRFFKENNLLDNAIAAYNLTIEFSENANFQFQLARIYGEKGDFDKMFTSYINLIDNNENYIGTVKRYASSYITDDANNSYNLSFKKALLRKSISNPKVVWNELLSWLFTKQSDYGKAFIQEKAIYQRKQEDLSSFFVLGDVAYNNKAYDSAKDIFTYTLEKSFTVEEKIEAQLFLLKIDVALKEENAQESFEKTLNLYGYSNQTIYIQKAYADYLTSTLNEPEKAKAVLEKALELANSKFEKARIKLKLGDVLVYTNQFNKALIYFSQIQTKLKNHPLAQQARFKVAETSFFKGDFTWAKAQLKVLKGSTSQLIANDAVDLFLIISDNEPRDSVSTGLKDFAKGRLFAYQNKNLQAIDILSSILKDYQGQNIEDEALLELGNLYVKTEQFEAAVTSYKKIIEINKTGVFVDDAYYFLAEVYRNHIKDLEKASEYYQKIIFEQASSIYLVEARKKFRQLRGDSIN